MQQVSGYDLEDVLSALKSVALGYGPRASNEFYHACLDRIDELVTERGSRVGKREVVQILRILSYFRPRTYEQPAGDAFGAVPG